MLQLPVQGAFFKSVACQSRRMLIAIATDRMFLLDSSCTLRSSLRVIAAVSPAKRFITDTGLGVKMRIAGAGAELVPIPTPAPTPVTGILPPMSMPVHPTAGWMLFGIFPCARCTSWEHANTLPCNVIATLTPPSMYSGSQVG